MERSEVIPVQGGSLLLHFRSAQHVLAPMGCALAVLTAFAVAGCGKGGDRRPTVVEGHLIVEAPPQANGVASKGYVGLHVGHVTVPHLAKKVDDMYLLKDDGHFVLRADARDGAVRFFVFAEIETAFYEKFCVYKQLPLVRVSEVEGKQVWLDARTGRPLPALTLRPRIRLEDCL